MRDFLQLPCDGRVDFRMPVTVEICPDGSVGVEKLTAFHVAQHRAFAAGDDNRLALEPVAHLRERMPDEFLVEAGEFVHDDFKLEISGFKSARAHASSDTSAPECAAVSVTRSRAAPRATVG